VVTGVSNRVSVQIVSGLQPGERVVVGERRGSGETAQRSGPPMPARL
jgi:hypothetical protein